MAFNDDIQAIRDNLVAELKAETAARRALVESGKPPPTTYSANGRSVDWNGYLRAMREQIEGYNELLQKDEAFELPMEGFTT